MTVTSGVKRKPLTTLPQRTKTSKIFVTSEVLLSFVVFNKCRAEQLLDFGLQRYFILYIPFLVLLIHVNTLSTRCCIKAETTASK